MVSPIEERAEPSFFNNDRSSQEDTMVDSNSTQNGGTPNGKDNLLKVDISNDNVAEAPRSPSQTREESHRIDDELMVLQLEREVSRNAQARHEERLNRSRSRRDDTVDDFDVATNPLHEKAAVYKPPEHPTTAVSKFFKKVHDSSFLVRWITYITPVVGILLIPLLLGIFVFEDATVGGVKLMWFGIWLEIVWLSLWAGRLLAKALPWPLGLIASLFTNNAKKWRDMVKQLEMPAALFFWWLAIEVSFLPTMKNHHLDGNHATTDWEKITNKVIISFFVLATLNFAEKIIIQLIAISFHLRTYQDRIDINKFQIGSLTKLYKYSKEKIAMEDSDFEEPSQPGSGARTPGQIIDVAQKTTKHAFSKFGDVAGRIAGDFTGHAVVSSTHPHQIVLALLNTTPSSQVLARRLYRTFARPETETVFGEDLKYAFENDEEAEAAFSMFDKDMNGDISMEELEAVCVEIGRERKSITASLKDLDSVVGKLDDVFVFLIVIIAILVLVSLISTSAAGVLTSLGSSVLALSWLFSTTAQEFLQSVIFVFVKHPFDVGDRVTIYGNTGKEMTGDDYFVKEISLLYTEFKKMEGHIVQAPNSYLNQIFILNQRRSGGLAEAVTITIKFGTTLDQIEQLRNRLLDFVKQEKREFQSNILTELRDITEVHSLNLNVVFFYKSNWQNEGLRLARRNKFICAMMVTIQDLNIEGPRMRYPGQKPDYPVYLQNIPQITAPPSNNGGYPDLPPPSGTPDHHINTPPLSHHPSILRSQRSRGESLSQMNRRVDFSLGARSAASADHAGDVFEARTLAAAKPPIEVTSQSSARTSGAESRPRGSSSSARPRASTSSASRTFSPMMQGAGGTPTPRRLDRVATEGSMKSGGSGYGRNRFFRPRAASRVDEEMGRGESEPLSPGLVRDGTGVNEKNG
ncbi:MAG: hypothetical protein M1820_005415 [Bogoriella megaspora]|nr:MAG: hypothetical protein M1820_005415 [Bogoriella megaspora]